MDVFALPAELRRINIAVIHGDILALTDGLDAHQIGFGDLAVAGIPDGCTGFLVHSGIEELETFHMPQRIAQGEAAVLNRYIPCLLQDGLTVCRACENAVANMGVPQIIQGTFFVKLDRFDAFHSISPCGINCPNYSEFFHGNQDGK
jgi:hypothetical protein